MHRRWAMVAVLVAVIAGVILLARDNEDEACGTTAVRPDPEVALTDDPALALFSYLTVHGDGGVIRGSEWPQTLDEPDEARFVRGNVTVVVLREPGGWRATQKRVVCG